MVAIPLTYVVPEKSFPNPAVKVVIVVPASTTAEETDPEEKVSVLPVILLIVEPTGRNGPDKYIPTESPAAEDTIIEDEPAKTVPPAMAIFPPLRRIVGKLEELPIESITSESVPVIVELTVRILPAL